MARSWLLTSDLNADAIIELLRPIVGADDRIIVLEIAEDMSALNLEGHR